MKAENIIEVCNLTFSYRDKKVLDNLSLSIKKREFKVECNQGKPQVNYKEAITETVNLREVYKKQSGGRGKFADIIVNVGPVDEDFKEGGLQFVNKVTGGNIPKEFIPSVQKGFENAMKSGVLGGYPLDSLKVERKIVLARKFDVVRSIYIVRNLTNPKKSYKEFRVVGLIWNEEFTNLMPGNKRK